MSNDTKQVFRAATVLLAVSMVLLTTTAISKSRARLGTDNIMYSEDYIVCKMDENHNKLRCSATK